MPRIGGAKLAFGAAFLLLIGAGGYAYQSGMIDAFIAAESTVPTASTPETGSSAQPAAAESAQTVFVKSGSINIRAEASAESAVVGSAAEGTPLTVLGRDGNWIKIRIPGSGDQTGWVHTSRLDPNSLPPQ
jgi:SH3-like domain-containing protein